MTEELKTLKELECFDLSDCDSMLVSRDELRKEAIKWIKELSNGDSLSISNGLPITDSIYELWTNHDELIFWIKFFFNINEEDLK